MLHRLKAASILVAFVGLWIPTLCLAASPEEKSKYIREVQGHDWVIVFVHGIIGDSKDTWTNGNTYWPALLTSDKDFDGASIYVYEYPTSVSSTMSLNEVAENMRLIFNADGVSQHNNIVFIAHSMGGLVLRNYLLKYREVASRVRMSYFFATPTTGSEIAAIVGLVPKVGPQVKALRPMERASDLANTQLDWRAARFKFPSYCAFETLATYGIVVVPQASATNLCDDVVDPINSDHFSIVKPSGPRSLPYLAFKAAFMQTRQRASLQTDPAVVLTALNQAIPEGMNFNADRPYELRLDVRLSFKNSAFNQDVYLSGLNPVGVTQLPSSDDKGYVTRERSDDVSAAKLLADKLPKAQPPTEARYRISIQSANKPSATDIIELQAGPRSLTFRLGELDWKQGGKDIKGWWSAAAARVLMDDPDWVVPHYARFLKMTSSKNASESQLEVVLENLSKSNLLISELSISASGNEGEKCAALPANENIWRPAPQNLVVNWSLVLEGKKVDRTASSAAWVKLGHSAVPVEALFAEKDCRNARLFHVKIPVDLDVAAAQLGRIRLNVTEMTQLSGAKSKYIPREPIAALPDWPYVNVSLKPDARVFPKSVSVSGADR
ncbi:triacylglycerol lipase [Bradyrhizobium sp. JYMT SZCCT0428]|uniref:esterase/lipase family protein n=1 Tax=Bradyrhizobium sp. JYMT SZCCT0428 TaxID=2807673 RepID=UPI001BA565FC|nr:alpha/beta fold hydrolase [Bradyrhizobium sp. JYMT SZCCT0428]MBR1154530.1 hypothetical protein [Bradyrhizobium sp. JYMT SZCCT0428]